ncbi:MAG: hypothetical protein NTW48_01350 [Chloroflexi bacterium]|nr:hypothetical protein [Chloroflexota bacterium]
MAKINMLCPFNHKLCDECPLYRGRHYYLCFCEKYRGYIGESEERAKSSVAQHPVDLLTIWKQIEPWAGVGLLPGIKSKIKLKVIDMESGATRGCDLDEAKTWDWSNPQMMRMIGGVQITSWNKLVELVSFKAKKGYREVELYEAPRFIMLGGG